MPIALILQLLAGMGLQIGAGKLVGKLAPTQRAAEFAGKKLAGGLVERGLGAVGKAVPMLARVATPAGLVGGAVSALGHAGSMALGMLPVFLGEGESDDDNAQVARAPAHAQNNIAAMLNENSDLKVLLDDAAMREALQAYINGASQGGLL